MIAINKIKSLPEAKAEKLYHSVALCNYCKTPFKDCDTVIPGKGVVLGEMDVVQYKSHFWHYSCVFDYEKR